MHQVELIFISGLTEIYGKSLGKLLKLLFKLRLNLFANDFSLFYFYKSKGLKDVKLVIRGSKLI